MEETKLEKKGLGNKNRDKKLKKQISVVLPPNYVEKKVTEYEEKIEGKPSSESDSDSSSEEEKVKKEEQPKKEEQTEKKSKKEKEEEEGESSKTQAQTNFEREERTKIKSFKSIVLDSKNFSKPSKDVERYARKGDFENLKAKQKYAAESQAFLHAAWARNNAGLEAIKLLEKQVDVNMRDPAGYTALHLAAVRGNEKVVQVLLENPRTMVRPYDGAMRTPLMYAIIHQNNEVVKILADKENSHCNINERRADKLGNTSLHIAIKSNNVEAVSLVANEGNVKKENEEGDTPLMLCARENNYLAMSAILNKFKNKRFIASIVNHVDSGKVSVVHIAANRGAYHCLKYIFKFGDIVDYDKETDKGITPLAFAVGSGSIETARLFLDYFNPRGQDAVRNMIQYSPHVKKPSPWKIATVTKADAAMTQLLLDYGAKIDEKVEGGTALYHTVMEAQRKTKKRDESEIVRLLDFAALLLANKADVNIPNEDEVTALHVIADNLKLFGIPEDSIKEYPSAAVHKWKKYASAASAN